MATVKGTAAADQLAGTATADTISGLAENDKLEGLAGNDILIGGLGADQLIGGSEIDTASYATATVGVVLSLAAGSGTAGEALGDTYNSIENLIGSAKDDQLTGDDNANKIEGLALNDKLFGGKGADILDGGAGDDLIEGGEGADKLVGGAHTAGIGDTVSYAASASKVEINLTQQGTYSAATGLITGVNAIAQTGGDAAGDLLSGIENVIGSAGNDKITGDANANIIEGGDGADILDGGAGIDTLSYASDTTGVTVELGALGAITATGGHATGDSGTGFENIRGGSGNDKLTGNTLANKLEGGAGNDTLIGAAGIDTLDGGNDSDTVDYSSQAQAFTVALALAGKTAKVGGALESDAKGDILSNIENAIGGGGNDVITGNNFNNTILGGGSDDTIDGSTGDVDRLDGGAGINDTVSYASYVGTGVSANLSQQGTGDALTGAVGVLQVDLNGGDGDYLWNFENITGSKQNDILIGDAGVNKIIGGLGADIIEGGAGADILDGGALAESNTLSYAGDTAGVTVALKGTANATVLGTGHDAEGDQAKNFLNLIGGSGSDTLTGDAGNNVIEGGAGGDILDGGAGTSDTLSYASSGSMGVTLNEGANKATVSGSHATGDTATNFENVAGSAFGDDLTGNSIANILNGAGAADYLEGRGGADKLIGGDGTDTAGYTLSAAPVTVNLSKQGIFNPAKNAIDKATAQSGGDAAGDLLAGIENVIGSAGNDTLTGDAASNKLEGELGNDRLEGGAGADILDGGDDIDTVSYANALTGIAVSLFTESGTAGDAQGDQLISIENITGSGKDDIIVADDEQAVDNLFDGGAGLDTISYANLSTGPVSINLSTQGLTGTAPVVGGTGSDKIVNFENAIGTGQGDTITGSSVANVIEGGFGGDILDGGSGIDTLSYASSAIKVNVTLKEGAIAADIVATGGDADADSAKNFENLRGSAYNDILTGNSIANIVDGGDGNDTLSGLGAIDTLIGGKDDDTLNGGAAGDKLVGGDGIDTADYSTSALAVTIDLSKQGTFNAATNKIDKATAQKGGDAASDLLSGIENVIGSGQNDLFTGSAGANKFDGGGDDGDVVTYLASTVALTIDLLDGANGSGEAKGDTFVNVERIIGTKLGDTLVAGNDNVTLDGGDGDDTLVSGDDGDTLAGGAGIDTVSYRNSSDTNGVTVDLALLQGPFNSATGQFTGPVDTQDASTGGDRYSSIENATGSSYGDVLKGNSGANRLDGGTGDDDLQGGLGDDFLEGGDGFDTANYSGVIDSVTANLATHRATGAGAGIGTDTLSNVERIVGTAVNDTLTGDEFDNELVGGTGDDILDGGAGADVINGGSGGETNGDTVTYVSATAGVTLSLLTPANSAGDAAGDTFTGIEIILGSNFADSITGDGNENTLQGGKGNDTLDGGGDIDTLDGGDGDDILIGGAGADALKGGAGEDTASYETAVGVGVTLVLGVAGNGDATGDTFDSIENLTGSGHDDDLTGDAKNNVLTGGAGADKLTGGGGNDTASYSGSSKGVSVDLNTGVGAGLGDAAGDELIDIDNVVGSDFDDEIIGTTGANTLTGGLGDDTLEGDDGNDLLDGGAGIDTASYSGAANTVTVNLGTNSATGTGIGTDTLASIENVVGSSQNDTIIGNNNVNVLDGGLGDDTLTGGESADTFIIDDISGEDTVTDFNTTFDVLDFSNTGLADFDAAKFIVSQVGNDTVFTFSAGNTLTLKNVFSFAPGIGLSEANFAFAPTDISIVTEGQNAVTVSEGLAIGESVGTLIGKDDHDSGEALIYKIETDPSGLFDIKNDRLVLKAGLDFESNASHSVGIRVYDSTGASYLETLTVNVTDANDAPTDILIDQDTITEIAAIGDVVGTLSATDQDVPANTFTYTLVDDAGGLFALDGDQIKVAGALDFEGSAVHTITVKVDDGAGGSYTRTIDINIEDAVEGFGADGYVSGANVFYDSNDDLDPTGEAFATTSGANGQFALKSGGTGDLVLIGGTDISTGFEFHGIMKAPNGASVITPLTTLWTYLTAEMGNSETARLLTGTALGFDANTINMLTYDPITAALSADPTVAAQGSDLTQFGMQVQNTIALLTAILIEAGDTPAVAADYSARALAAEIADVGGLVDFTNQTFIQNVIDEVENLAGETLAEFEEGDVAQIIAGFNQVVLDASGVGIQLLEDLAQITAVVHLAAEDFEGGTSTTTMLGVYTGGTRDFLISQATAENVEGFNTADTINGTAGADTIYGYGGVDTLNGLAGNDTLDGGEGDDTLNGGDGRDVLIGGTGEDKFDGGGWYDGLSGASFGDFDIVSFAGTSVAVSAAIHQGFLTQNSETDTVTHVEGIIGSSAADVLQGGANDYLETFQGGGGGDFIYGNSGLDRAIYSDATGGVTINLAAGTAAGNLSVGTDELKSIEEIVGSNFNDTFNAAGFGNFSVNAGSRGTYNSFRPGDGDDLIIGNGNTQLDYSDGAHGISIDLTAGKFFGGLGFGTDTFSGVNRVRGTAFDDVLAGGQDAYGQPGVSEVYTGGGGNDTIIGGSGFDVANYAFATDAYVGGIVVNLAAGTVTGDAKQVGTDTLRGVEGIIGTAEADTYDATGFSTTSVNAAAFNTNIDEFEGGAGNDIIKGSGSTRISYISATAGITVDLSKGLNVGTTVTGNASVGVDTLQGGVMSVRGTRFDDKLIGFDNADGTVQFFEAADGNDIIDGKGGYDVANYLWDSSVKGGIRANLSAGTVVGIGSFQDNFIIGTDTLLSVEGVRGTSFADVFDATGFSSTTGANKGSVGTGTNAFNTFEGGGGNDTVIGNGATRVEYGTATSGVLVTLVNDTSGKGSATGDSSVGFDTFNGGVSNIRGSSYDDVLTGNANKNSIEGQGGNDIIRGGAGSDKLDGGEYMDGISASGMNDFDWLDYSTSTASVTVNLYSFPNGPDAFREATDGLGSTESTHGFEAVIGGSGADTLNGGIALFEIYQGGKGDDKISGFGGMDIASYVDATAGVTFNLKLGGPGSTFDFKVTAAGVGIDTLTNIEGIYGSAFDDIFNAIDYTFGSTGTNLFRGGGGNDTIIGNANATMIVGRTIIDYSDATAGMTINLTLGKVDGSHAGVGIDTFSGVNAIIGTNFDDVLIGGQADRNRTAFETNSGRFEVFDGGKGNDFIDGGSGFDYADYSRGIGALQTKGIHVFLADGIVIGDADVFGTDTLRGVEIIIGTQLDDIYDARGFGLSSTNGGYDSRQYGLIPVIDEVPGAYNEFTGGAGNDTIYGNGYTLLNYSKATGGITADLNLTTGAITGNVSVGTDSIGGNVGDVRSLIGTNYADVITGNAFDNYIQGGFSKTSAGDVIDGGAGNDFIQGGAGDDKITGGTGDDIMGGGSPLPGTGQVSSNDTFYFEAGHGSDIIYDFNFSAAQGEHDVIVIEGVFADFADMLLHTESSGSFTYINTDGTDNEVGGVIILSGIGSAYTPQAQDFVIIP